MEALQILSRSEMKAINGGYIQETCRATVTCPSGRTISCWTDNSDGHCHEGDGFVNCNTGQMIIACWQLDEPY